MSAVAPPAKQPRRTRRAAGVHRHDAKGPNVTTVETSPQAASTVDRGQQVADVLVVFGITGDLAKVMTFH